MGKIKFDKIRLKDIIPYENNTKEHTEEQLSDIMDSIMTFGYLDPIGIDEKNEIVEGHGRYTVMCRIYPTKEEEIQVIRLIDIDENGRMAYRIAHNKIASRTGFLKENLKKEFNLLEDTDYFHDTGFEVKEITELWEQEDEPTSECIESDKSTTIQHRCPECNHTWEEEIKKSRSRN